MTDRTDLPYRQGAGFVLFDDAGLVFVGRRIKPIGVETWQFPQGGIDDGEAPLEAALRELEEEIGTRDVEVLEALPEPIAYDLPADLDPAPKWASKYRGQRQHWFAGRLRNGDADIDLATEHPEFDAYRWEPLEEAVAGAVPFKREVYERLGRAFAHLARPGRG